MQQFVNYSESGNVAEATKGLKAANLIMLFEESADRFEESVKKLEELYPGVPSIGCIAMGYSNKVGAKGTTVIAFTEGVEVATGVVREVSKAPVRYLEEMEANIKKVHPGNNNTVCIDFCTGNDACVLATYKGLLTRYNISLMGGTGDGGKMACNGVVYEDCDVYCIVKNLGGKVKVYKENMYKPLEGFRFIASKTDHSKCYVGELNGQSAKQVYCDSLGIEEKDINTQTFKNPLGKMAGKDICIISIKEVDGQGLCCFRQVNDSDVLTILEVQDYMEVAEETIRSIKEDFTKVSGVFSVNCLFRYLLFTDEGKMDDYLKLMNGMNNYCGYIGYGEHYNDQFVNQSMSCVVFE